MATWLQITNHLDGLPDDATKTQWLNQTLQQTISTISTLRGNRNVIFYASSFLQKPQLPGFMSQITHEDINGFMTCVNGMNCQTGLVLLLHTPGGVTNAAETIVNYLHSKFPYIEVIVPTYAMSAGTMISLAADRIVMGRQSQLGPIDPQMPLSNTFVSARAIVEQFNRASHDIRRNKIAAHVWAPILQSLGPALLIEAENALTYGEKMVANWLQLRMLAGNGKKKSVAVKIAKHFNDASAHKSHGRRIDRKEAKANGVVVDDLESDQNLQDAVLTLYHLMTILIEKSPTAKALVANNGHQWIKYHS